MLQQKQHFVGNADNVGNGSNRPTRTCTTDNNVTDVACQLVSSKVLAAAVSAASTVPSIIAMMVGVG